MDTQASASRGRPAMEDRPAGGGPVNAARPPSVISFICPVSTVRPSPLRWWPRVAQGYLRGSVAVGGGRHGEFGDPGGGEGGLDLRVGAERAGFVAQDQVVAHARGGGGPHAVVVFGPRRVVVEVHDAVVAAGLQGVDDPERAAGGP